MINPHHRRLRRVLACLVGIVLLVSGLLKMIDPVGTMLIFREYFKIFGLTFLDPAARVLGILLALLESLLGIALIAGVLRKAATRCTVVLLSFFTIVTLVLWITDAPMDCGCFGEAIHLTHPQSFWKNVVLLAMTVVVLIPPRSIGHPRPRKMVTSLIAAAAMLLVVLYSNTHLPIMDFTEFSCGAELFASLDDDIAAERSYQPSFIYEKDGQESSFDLSELPDSTWTFVRVDTLSHGSFAADVHPVLSFRDAEGNYQDSLAAQGHVVVLSVYESASAPWESVRQQYLAVAAAGGTPLLLVSAVPEEPSLPRDLPLFYADYKTLITLNRSNGGGSYFDDGELVNKWDPRHVPADWAAIFAADPVDLSTRYIVKRRLLTQGFCVSLAALLLLV